VTGRAGGGNASGDAKTPHVLPCRKLAWPQRVARKVTLVKSKQFGLRDLTKFGPDFPFQMRRRPGRNVGRRSLSVHSALYDLGDHSA